MQDYSVDDVNYIDDPFIEEMIDGKIYLMARPGNKHMLIQSYLNRIFNNYFERKKKKCKAVYEMQLYINDRNYFQPDLMIYCKNNNEKKNKKIPLIVIEVLSDSTWKIDITAKMKKYAELEIEEYWIIDPRNQRLNIYKLDGERYDLYESYYHPFADGFSVVPKIREKEESEIIREFSPAFFPDMTILLADVFNFDDLDIIP
jgi:Uma2 family endonuclease